MRLLDLRWNNFSSDAEAELIQSIKQNTQLLELRLKGNKFSQSFFESVEIQINKNNELAGVGQIQKLTQLRKKVESSVKGSETSKSGEFYSE